MYATAGQFLGTKPLYPISKLNNEPYIPHHQHSKSTQDPSQARNEPSQARNEPSQARENFISAISQVRSSPSLHSSPGQVALDNNIPLINKPNTLPTDARPVARVAEGYSGVQTSSADPKVWGPPFWFTLHNSAVNYPLEASPLVKERMKGRLLAIPYEIPCTTCRPHASAFIEKHKDNLDSIVSGRHSLGQFYVDFHNAVNKRYNKPVWTYQQAYKHYSGQDLP